MDRENTITIVMYHYVRDPDKTAFPNIKARRIEEFKRQIEYLKENYHILGGDELKEIMENNINTSLNITRSYKKKAFAVLTFDDGYIDHYKTVLPILKKHRLKGIFGPIVAASIEKKVILTNKLHFILSVMEDNIPELIEKIFKLLDKQREEYNLEENDFYIKKLSNLTSRFDTPQITFVKRLLQKELPGEVREKIISTLFEKYITKDEKGFAESLYMQAEHIKALVDEGMEIMGHSYSHPWLDNITKTEQHKEVELTRSFLEGIRENHTSKTKKDYIFCYPYGAWNEDLLSILKKNNFIIGFTTIPRVAHKNDNPLLLPRLDTNDLPH